MSVCQLKQKTEGKKMSNEHEVEKLLLKPSEAFKAMSIGRSTGYAMIASGELPSVRIGRAVRVPVNALKQWVERQIANGSKN
jgi:excisionase family DNA binding protein